MCSRNPARPRYPELLLTLLVFGGVLVSIAAQGLQAPRPASFYAFSPLPSATPGPTPTNGWWGEEEFTAEKLPFIATLSTSLPDIPKIELGIATRMPQSGRPIAYEVVACADGQARITGIVTGQPGWWEIMGSAPVQANGYWKGEISGDGQNWTLLYASRQPVENGLLLRFLTTTVPKGSYLLRVLLVDHTGNYPPPCTVRIVL